jgi:hypothetical protein
MNLKNQIKIVLSYEKTKSDWRHKHLSDEFIAASNLAKIVLGMPLNKSRNCECIEDLFFYLKRLTDIKINQIQTRMENQENAQFTLIKGKVLVSFHGTISKENLTDEKAIALIKRNPKNISHFKKFPKDWENLIGLDNDKQSTKEQNSDSVDYSSMSLKELRAMFPEVTARSKKEFISEIPK